jgi:hypothetical protein
MISVRKKVNKRLWLISWLGVHTIIIELLTHHDTAYLSHQQCCGRRICITLGRYLQGNYPCGILLVGLHHRHLTRFHFFMGSCLYWLGVKKL